MTDPDVMVLKPMLDPTAARLAFADEITFREAISGMPTHNHINQAYHDAKVHHLCPPYDWRWDVPAFTVPLRVRRLLRANELVAELKAKIAKAREAIERAKPYMDNEVTRQLSYTPDGAHPPVHASIVVTRVAEGPYPPCWAYTFNGYDLAHTLLNDYEQFIDKTMQSRLSDFTKLGSICRRAEWYSTSITLATIDMSVLALSAMSNP